MKDYNQEGNYITERQQKSAMPTIKYAHLCEYARVDASGTVSIIGIFDTINVNGLPANFPILHVITNLSGERGEQFQFLTRIAGPDGTVLQVAPPVDIHIQRDEASSNQINGYIGLVLPTLGNYSVEFLINGMVVHTLPFQVVLQQR